MKLSLVLLMCLFSFAAHAGVDISDGSVTIDVSGSDGNSSGDDGSSAGRADVTLSYDDAEKTLVRISGELSYGGRPKSFSEVLPLKSIKQIRVYAVGGDGADGHWGSDGWSGSSGFSGSSGWDGHSGCPPGDGSDGRDGSDGTDGSDGGDGGNGGNGGRGGTIVVKTSPEESELLLLVKTSVSGGSAGEGGRGGSGGAGGRGGDGGRGGRGGQNICRDAQGNPIWGPNGRDGRDGQRGRDGMSGRPGSPGRSGWSGSSGSRTFQLVSADGSQNFTAPFDLAITGAQFVDENANSILEPGEKIYLTRLEITNRGPMPSPRGQVLKFTLQGTENLLVPANLNVKIDPIAAGARAVVELKKGSLTLLVPERSSLIGRKTSVLGKISINGIQLNSTIETSMAIGWPLSLTPSSSQVSGAFDVVKNLSYNLKNVGDKNAGTAAIPYRIALTWSSKTIPGSNVFLTLSSGSKVSLEKTVFISNLLIPAKGSTLLPVQLLIRNRALASGGSGVLRLTLQTPNINLGSDEVIQVVDQNIWMENDFSQVEWVQSLRLAGLRVQCQFPNLAQPTQEMGSIEIQKVRGSGQVKVQLTVPSSAPSFLSPIVILSSNLKTQSAYQAFQEGLTPQMAADFLNQLMAPQLTSGPWAIRGCEVRQVLP